MKFLIVDDDKFCRVLLAEILSDFGQCDMACNGYEAIDAFMQARSDNVPYDLICLDIIMPELDGLQVLKQIRLIESREAENSHDTVKVLMVSSISDFEHITMSFDPRFEAYMIKPFVRAQLFEHLAALSVIS